MARAEVAADFDSLEGADSHENIGDRLTGEIPPVPGAAASPPSPEGYR